MEPFIGKNFLLTNNTARTLFHDYAAQMPIIDYHCHISPKELAEDRRFNNLTEAWLGGDHYKWRLMRYNGVAERFITGDADPYEKFLAFANTMPRAVGNPVYQWAHLELQRFFGCDTPLNGDTAKEIWDFCNDKLQNDPEFSARGFVRNSNVYALVTTDDPIDTLEWHGKLKEDASFAPKVFPAWRPDKALYIDRNEFLPYMGKLSDISGVIVSDFDSLCGALSNRLDHFEQSGCKASDHGINGVYYFPATKEELNSIVAKRLKGDSLTAEELFQFQYNLLLWLGGQYAKREWVFEIHVSAARNANTSMFNHLGPDTGYDYISPKSGTDGIAILLDELNNQNALPKTILFSLNPNDNAIFNVISGSFQKEGIRSNVQQGSAWWFNDTKTGMINQMTSLAELSLLGNFVGMLTDSRSFLSYPRHEYFRRILCNLVGSWVEGGEYPNDISFLGKMVQDISYYNAEDFFGY